MSTEGSPAVAPTPQQWEVLYRLGSIFMPHATKRALELYPGRQGTARFVHYTTAAAALEIIESKRFWMRNAACMTDYSEVTHGYDILRSTLGEQNREGDLISALDACALKGEEWARDVLRSFANRVPQLQRYTYIASLSEHDAQKEDDYGRLSMWRAFGSSADRVAIVLSIPWFSGAALALNLIFSPVAYLKHTEVAEEFTEITARVRSNSEFLRQTDPKLVRGSVFTMLLTAVTCLKHAVFSEEREWRAIYNPAWSWSSSPTLKRSIKCVNGVPQHVCELPLDASVSPAVADLEFSRIFERLIIGPTQYAWPMRDAFYEALANAGVADAERKVIISWIPIRT